MLSFQIRVLLVSSPLSISIPPFSLAEPVALEFITMTLSAKLIVSVLTVVVVPETVRFPVIEVLPLLVVTLLLQET